MGLGVYCVCVGLWPLKKKELATDAEIREFFKNRGIVVEDWMGASGVG
jgi:hypothetical protein